MGWVGNNSGTHPFFFPRHLVPQNLRNIMFVCNFLNIGLGSKTKQCPSHFSKQSIPRLFYLEPHRKVNATTLELSTTNFKNLKTNRPTRFRTLICWWNLGLQKPGICPRQPPGGFIFPEMTPQQIFSGNLDTLPKSSFFYKMASFFLPFVGAYRAKNGPIGLTNWKN